MKLRLAVALAFTPGAAAAHDAFGDLGPFYASLLHPLVDPMQGVVIVALSALLASQPRNAARPAYLALALAGAAAVAGQAGFGIPPLAPVAGASLAAICGLLAALGRPLPTAMVAGLAAAAACFAGLEGDAPGQGRAALLGPLGAAAGIALPALLVWGGLDLLRDRLGRVAPAVAGAWTAAVGLMVAALPG